GLLLRQLQAVLRARAAPSARRSHPRPAPARRPRDLTGSRTLCRRGGGRQSGAEISRTLPFLYQRPLARTPSDRKYTVAFGRPDSEPGRVAAAVSFNRGSMPVAQAKRHRAVLTYKAKTVGAVFCILLNQAAGSFLKSDSVTSRSGVFRGAGSPRT